MTTSSASAPPLTKSRPLWTVSPRHCGSSKFGDLDLSTFDNAVGTGARHRSVWSTFAWTLHDLLPAINGADPDDEAIKAMALLARPDGDDGNTVTTPPTEADQEPNGTYQAIVCDWQWPANPEDYYADMRKVAEEIPYGDAVSSVSPHNRMFATGRDSMTAVKSRKHPAGVVVQGEGDTQTAYTSGSAADHLDMPLITAQNSGIHGYYGSRGNTCVDTAVNAYLIDGTLPGRRTTCAAGADTLPDIAPGSTGGPPAQRPDTSIEELLNKVK